MTVVIDKKLHRQVMVKAAKEGVKITELLRNFLKRWLDEEV